MYVGAGALLKMALYRYVHMYVHNLKQKTEDEFSTFRADKPRSIFPGEEKCAANASGEIDVITSASSFSTIFFPRH
jgi:hypothetical protein